MKILGLAVLALTFGAGAAKACSCAPLPAPAIALKEAKAVFVGRVTSIQKDKLQQEVGFDVIKIWKGISKNTATILTATNRAACGVNFEKNEKYLVYAFKNQGDENLRTNLCTRTRPLTTADDDLNALGAPVFEAPRQDGIVQLDPNIHIGTLTRPLTVLNETLARDQKSARFRVSWNIGWLLSTFPKISGEKGYSTALYDRSNGTLKFYSQTVAHADQTKLRVQKVLYAGVTDAMLQELAEKYPASQWHLTNSSLFDHLPEFGATQTDLGSVILANPPKVLRPR